MQQEQQFNLKTMTAIPENKKIRKEQYKGVDNDVLILYIDPASLSGVGTIYEQLKTFLNANVTIVKSYEESSVKFAVGFPPDPDGLPGFPYTFPYILS